MRKLPHKDQTRLAAAVDALRAQTSARFEVMVVSHSDRYALYPVAFGAFAALAVVGLIAAFRPSLAIKTAFFAEAIVFVAVSAALEWLPLKLWVVPRHYRRERARQLAHRAFAARILAARERKTGMLLFVSLGERTVELVTDDALDRKIGQARWNAIIADCTAAAAKGQIGDGLVHAVQDCAEELAKHFPKEH
jgi:putative membrane protein